MQLEQISIELTNRCLKGCAFCYNHSHRHGESRWTIDELETLLVDCGHHGVQAVSFGGGEPLEFNGVFELLERLDGVIFRSLTTHGLCLSSDVVQRLLAARPDKVHISIHFPQLAVEVDRVVRQVHDLQEAGLASGINLLVCRSNLSAARIAAQKIRDAGIQQDRIVYLPMRGADTPTPEEIAEVADVDPFQSMTCLTRCGRSERFCSLAWDKTVAWCSYTQSRQPLKTIGHAGILAALEGLGVEYCGGADNFPLLPVTAAQHVSATSLGVEFSSSASNANSFVGHPSDPVQLHLANIVIRVPMTTTERGSRALYFRWPDGAAITLDYPAAHSVDTALHAVDRDGNVAVLSAYLSESVYDRPDTLGPKFEPESGEVHLAKTVRDAEEKLRDIADCGYYNFHFNSQHDFEAGQYVASRLPLNPASFRQAMQELDPHYQRRVHYPWMSFDNLRVLPWPPRAPKTIQDWTQLVDAATDYWQQTLENLKHAERAGSDEFAYWQTVSNRQWESLQHLERELARRSTG